MGKASQPRAVVPMEKARLVELDAQSRRVFGDIPRPTCTKSVAESLDDDWIVTEESWKALTAMDPEQHWWEVNAEEHPDFWNRYHSIFSFLSPEGLRFYYVAMLSQSIRHWHGYGSRHWMLFSALQQWKDLTDFKAEELRFLGETLTELSCDDPDTDLFGGIYPTLYAIEARYKQLTGELI